jgi:hypothetical protein
VGETGGGATPSFHVAAVPAGLTEREEAESKEKAEMA